MAKTFEEVYAAAEELAGELIDDSTEIRAEVAGLDPRAAFTLWITEAQDAIIVQGSEDRTLQYYGGFEYVEKQYRMELGGYVVYSGEDSRVREHLDIALDVEKDDPPPSPEDIAASKADQANDAAKCDE